MRYVIYPTPEETKQETEKRLAIFKNFERTKVSFDFKDVNDNHVYLNDEDVIGDGITVTTFLNSDNDIVFGKAVSTEVVAYFEKNAKTLSIDWSKESALYIQYYYENTWYNISFAHFVGSEPKAITYNDTEIFEFRSNDYMVKFDISADDLLDSITYPCYSSDIYEAVAAYLGISVHNTQIVLSEYIPTDPFQRGCTLRDVLQYCAEFCGMYFIFDQVADYLSLLNFARPLYNIEYKLTPDDYFEMRKSYIQVPSVPAIVYIDSDGRNLSYPSTYTGIPYVIYDNPLWKTMSDADIVTRLQYMKEHFLTYESPYDEYYPLSVYAPGNPMVQVGDIIDVVDKEGNEIPLRIFSRVFHWNGGACTDYYECTGSAIRQEMHSEGKQQIFNDERYALKTELSEVSAALDSFIYGGSLPNNTALNTVVEPGFYLLASDRSFSDTPPDGGTINELLVSRPTPNTSTILQIGFGISNIYYRFRVNATTWGYWRKVSATAVT